MSTWQLRILAIGIWAAALACGIAFLAMRDEYTNLRDGVRVDGEVTAVAPQGSGHRLTVRYREPGIRSRPPGPEDITLYSYRGQTPPAVGDRIPLVLDARNHLPSRASKIDAHRPTIFLLIGAIVGFVLGGWTLLAPRRAARRRAARRDPFDVIVDGLARTRNVMLGLAGFLVGAVGFFAIVLGAASDEATTGELAVIGVLAVASIAMAVWLGREALRLRDPRHNHVTELLAQRTAELAWFYVRRITRRGMLIQDAMIWGSDGKLAASIRLVPEDVDAVVAEVARRAPHAARGFSPELERQYRERPDRWRPG